MDVNSLLTFLTEIETVSPSKSNLKKIQAHVAQLSQYSFKGNDEVVLIKCILKYIDYVINIASNKPCKDQMKICKRSFSIITKIISKEVQYTFMKEITKRIFDIVIDDDVQNWCIKKELLKMFIICIENSDRNLRLKTVQELPQIYLFKLMDTVSMCGDFDFQLSLIEVVFRMYGKSTITAKLKDLIPESQDLSENFANISAETFDESVRKFLNLLNSTTGKVFSVVCKNVHLGNLRCEKPMDGVDGLWVDFNLSENVISWFCNKNSFSNKDSDSESVTENDKVWNLITLFTSDVEMVQIHRPSKSDSVLIYFKLKDSCLSSFDDNQMIVGTADNLKLVVSYNSNKTTTLLSKILPSLFGSKYSHSSAKVSSSKKIYKPLNITVSRKGKSELSKSKSDTSSFVTFFDPIGGKSTKSANTSSRDEASFRKTISVSSASTKCEVISIPDSSTHSTELSVELVQLKPPQNKSERLNTENTEYETAQSHELSNDRNVKVSKSITPALNVKVVKKCSTSISPGLKRSTKKESSDSETADNLRSTKISTNIVDKKSDLPKKPTPVFLSPLDEGLRGVEEDITHIQILSGRCSGSNLRFSQISRSSAMTTSTPRSSPRRISDKEANTKIDQAQEPSAQEQSSSTDKFETAKDYTETMSTRNPGEFSEDFSSMKVNIFKHKGTMPESESVKVSSSKSHQNVSEYFPQQNASGNKKMVVGSANVNAPKTEDVIVISEDYVTPSQELSLVSDEKGKKSKETPDSLTFFKVSKPRENKERNKAESEEISSERSVKLASEVKVSQAHYKADRSDSQSFVESSDSIGSNPVIKVSKSIFTPVQAKLKRKKVTKTRDKDKSKAKLKGSDDNEKPVMPVEKITKTVEDKEVTDDKILEDEENVQESAKEEVGQRSPIIIESSESDVNKEKIVCDDDKQNLTDDSKSSAQISVKKSKRGRKIKKELISGQTTENPVVTKDSNIDIVEDTGVDLRLHEINDDAEEVVNTCELIEDPKEDLSQQPHEIEHIEQPDDNFNNSDNNTGDTGVENLPSHEVVVSPTGSSSLKTHENSKTAKETDDVVDQTEEIEQTECSNRPVVGNVIRNDVEQLLSEVNDDAITESSPNKKDTNKESNTQPKEIHLTEEKIESCESVVKPVKLKPKGKTKRRIICDSDENDITDNRFRDLRKIKKKKKAVLDSDDSDKENVEIKYSKHEKSKTPVKLLRELYVRLERLDQALIPKKYLEVESLDSQNMSSQGEVAANNEIGDAVEEDIFKGNNKIQEVESRDPLKEINDENLIKVLSDEYKVQDDRDSVFEKVKAIHEHTPSEPNEKMVSEAQANIIEHNTSQFLDEFEKEFDNIMVDDQKTADKEIDNTKLEKTVEGERTDMFFKTFFDQTLSTTVGGRKIRKLYNPKDLSYFQDTIEEDSGAPLNEPSVTKDIEVNDKTEPTKRPTKKEEVKEKQNKRKTTSRSRKQPKKEASFKQVKKMKIVNPNYMLEIPNERDKQKYSHLRPVFYEMVESFRQEVGKSFSEILEKNTPKEITTSSKSRKKNVRRYTKRTMKHKSSDNIVRNANKSNSSSDFSFTLRKKVEPSTETPYNSPSRIQQKERVNITENNNKKINIISNIQIRPKRALLNHDEDVSKRAKYDEDNVELAAFPEKNVINNHEMNPLINNEDGISGIVSLDRGLPVISKNITNEEISSWIVTGSPKYNKSSEIRYVLKHTYPMFKSLLNTSTVDQEHEDILKICTILQKYI